MSKASAPRMTAETAAISVTRTECVVRYTLPTPARTPLTTASKLAVLGPVFGGAGTPGGSAGTGAELPTIAPGGSAARPATRLYSIGPSKRPGCEAQPRMYLSRRPGERSRSLRLRW